MAAAAQQLGRGLTESRVASSLQVVNAGEAHAVGDFARYAVKVWEGTLVESEALAELQPGQQQVWLALAFLGAEAVVAQQRVGAVPARLACLRLSIGPVNGVENHGLKGA